MPELWVAIGVVAAYQIATSFVRWLKWNQLIPYFIVLILSLLIYISSTEFLDRFVRYFVAPVDVAGFLFQVGTTFIAGIVGVLIFVVISKVLRLRQYRDYNPYQRFFELKPLKFSFFVIFYMPIIVMAEELVFRVTMIGLGRSDEITLLEETFLIILSAIVFGMAHWSKESQGHAVYATIAGLIWGVSFTITGSIWVPFFAHFLHNAMAMSLVYIRHHFTDQLDEDESRA